MDENRDYFIITCNFQMTDSTKPESPGVAKPPEVVSTSQVQVLLELEDHILKDKKIKDEDLLKQSQVLKDPSVKWVSPCYSVKNLWGIPK